MPVEILAASVETKHFFAELPMPRGINGNQVKGKQYWDLFLDESKSINDLATINETYSRMQDFHDTLNSGRFFLANAQRSHFPEIYSGEPPTWANNWIKSQYLNSAIHSYSAAFDIYLQILWIGFGLYKQFPDKCPSILSDDTLDKILEVCNINRVKCQNDILGKELCDKIERFHSCSITGFVRNLCKQIKHRRCISYSELSQDKHPIMISTGSYNSHNTISEYSIDDIISNLKKFHKVIKIISNYTIPIVTAHFGKDKE